METGSPLWPAASEIGNEQPLPRRVGPSGPCPECGFDPGPGYRVVEHRSGEPELAPEEVDRYNWTQHVLETTELPQHRTPEGER